MRYFEKSERLTLEEILIYYLRTANDSPSADAPKVDPVKEFKRHGIANPNFFIDPIHRKIMKIVLRMDKDGIPLNIDTFKKQLDLNSKLEIADKNEIFQKFLFTKTEEYISVLYFEFYVHCFKEHILMDYWKHIFKLHEDRSWKSLDVIQNSFAIVDGFEKLWGGFTENVVHSNNESLKEELIERVRNVQEGKSTSVKIDLPEWDDFTGGFENSELYLIAGRPSMGKTTVAIAFAKRMIYRSKKVHLFTLEMTRKQIIHKFISDDLGISYRKIKRGDLTDEELEKVLESYDLYENHPYLVVDELSTQTMTELYEKMKNTPADCRIVDYLQLLRLDKNQTARASNREQEVGEISKGLKRFAKEFKNPVIALSQLSRAVESRQNKRPQLSDLRESGSLEQDADVIIFVYRDAYYQMQAGLPVDSKSQGNIELIIAKGREIGLRTFEMWLDLVGNKIYEGFKY